MGGGVCVGVCAVGSSICLDGKTLGTCTNGTGYTTTTCTATQGCVATGSTPFDTAECKASECQPAVGVAGGGHLEESEYAGQIRGSPPRTQGGSRLTRKPAAKGAREVAEHAGGQHDEDGRDDDQEDKIEARP